VSAGVSSCQKSATPACARLSTFRQSPLSDAADSFSNGLRGLRERGKCKMSVIGAAMRKLIHLAYGVLKTGKPFDPNWTAKTA